MPSAAGLLEGLLGGSQLITQIFLWQVLGQVIGALLQPYMTQAGYDVWKSNPLAVPTPPELADMVVRTIITEGQGAELAAQFGENAEHFGWRVLDTGEPPGLVQVLEWARRGFLPFDDQGAGHPSVPEAVRTSRIRNEWLPVILQGQFLPITAADAINAWVRGQISEAEALHYAYVNGLQEPEARILHNTVGRPPAPTELAEFVRRGLIPLQGTGPDALSLQQGIYEGDLKNKWEPIFEHLVRAIPSAFEIRRMQQAGALTNDQAAALYLEHGYDRDLVAGMVAAGSGTKTQGSKTLAQSTIVRLYEDRILPHDEAVAMLGGVGYDATEAGYVLTVADLALAESQVRSAIDKVRTAYLARRINDQVAVDLLGALGVPDAQTAELMGTWKTELAATIRVLTPAEVVDAAYYKIADPSWAVSELVALGYSEADAWVKLSVRMHGPQPGRPANAPPQPAA